MLQNVKEMVPANRANLSPTMRSLRERQRQERAALILGVAQDVFADK